LQRNSTIIYSVGLLIALRRTIIQPRRNLVPKRAAEYHRKVSEHLSHAAHNHERAARDDEIGRHDAAILDAQTASGHTIHARALAEKALKAHVEHLHLRISEISHRAKNMLSLVEAIARQTAAQDPEDFIGRFSERIQALSANQDLLARNGGRGSMFRIWCGLNSHTSLTSSVLVSPPTARNYA
jgi:hypothetical protein